VRYRAPVVDDAPAYTTAGPPPVERRPVVHEAHGVRRVDDYAWLADVGDPGVVAVLGAEREHYDAATAHLDSLRTRLVHEMTTRTPAEDRSVEWRRGSFVYYTNSANGEEYERIYRFDTRSAETLLLLDPNVLATESADLVREGSPYLDLGVVEPSPDGRLLAYAVDRTGEEVFTLRFRDLATGEDLPDVVPATYYTGAWSADSATFFYTVPDEVNRPFEVRRHVVGTDPAADVVVLSEPDQRFEIEIVGSRDGAWVMLVPQSRTSGEVWLVPSAAPAEAPRLVCPRRPDVEYRVEPLAGGWDGAGDDALLVVTDDGAPEFRLALAPVPPPGGTGDASSWATVPGAVATDGSERLESAAAFAGHVVLAVRAGTEPFLRVLPRGGAAAPYEVRSSVPYGQVALWHADDAALTAVTVVEQNLVTPPSWSEVDLATGARRERKRTAVPGADLSRYVTTRIEAPAADGELVPVTIAHPAGAVPDGTAACLLWGYGAYESCDWPQFDVGILSLLDRGVVFAQAHVRGGGERGRRWWLTGRLTSKPRTFTDFVAARDALVATGWADPARVVSRGLSAGGLLQAAVFSSAPDRWRAVVAEVPFVDVVTTMSNPAIPLTVIEWEEWGNPLADPDQHAVMLGYSPYDNPPAASGRPALLVTGAVNDPRVLVHEPAKWVARLRATDPDGDPRRLLFRVELGEGAHVGPSGRFAHLGYEAEVLAWVLDQVGVGS
jgi:oligopeptidase B